jgi:hypothetical protein
MRVAGLAPIEVPGIENINVTELVPGHMAYRTATPKLLREVGWMVESDEFAEIEDPDPDNHEQRQRELINEIEEARKELEQKPEKKGFSFWRKKKAAKKDWEVYDEHSQKSTDKDHEDTAAMAENPVIFDLDAIRKEVAALSAEGIEVKEIKSTLPPMKIDMAAAQANPYSTLRETKSYNDSIGQNSTTLGDRNNNHSPRPNGTDSTHNTGSLRKSYDEYEYDEHADGGMTMTFDTSFNDSPSINPAKSPAPAYVPDDAPTWDAPVERPPLKPAVTEPLPSLNAPLNPSYNAWADEFDDEFGKEKEIQMTFE